MGYGGKKRRYSSKVWWGKFCKALVFGIVVIVIGIYRYGSGDKKSGSTKPHMGAKKEIQKSDTVKIKILEDKAQMELLTGKYDNADKLYAKILTTLIQNMVNPCMYVESSVQLEVIEKA